MQLELKELLLVVTLSLYLLSLLFILLYSLSQGYLAYIYLKKRKPIVSEPLKEQYPIVTIQLPVYNEQYVIERLIDSIAELDYPKDKLEIQVIDDSDDETVALAYNRILYWAEKGVDIKHIRRLDRTGFKAGALKEALKTAKGEYVAIFDADFLPENSFLKQTLPAFTEDNVGMVQARWEHLNRNYSILTRSQAFTIDAHFYIEQTGRNSSGCFINFNGTAGVWRKDCIIDAGNWQADTLTEDLDLSYRAQLRGWRFVYLKDTYAPAELPPIMSAVKSQQYRWNKGGAETAKKLWLELIKADIPFRTKWHGSFHLFNSAVFIAVFISAVCSIPLLYFKQVFPAFRQMYGWLSIFLVSFLVVAWIYYIVNRQQYREKFKWQNYLKEFPLFLSISMGMSLHNALAVVEGYWGRKTPFIRTPKFSNESKQNVYVKHNISLLAIMELIMVLYFSYGIYYAFATLDFTMLPFHIMLTVGFAIVSYYTLFHRPYKSNATA